MPGNLPENLDELGLSEQDIKEMYPIWIKWVATERRYPPSVLATEPDRMLSFCIIMDNLLARVSKVLEDNKNGVR